MDDFIPLVGRIIAFENVFRFPFRVAEILVEGGQRVAAVYS